MNILQYSELYFLLDRDGGLIAFQEKDRSWAGALAFSNEQIAQQFIEMSNLEVAEIAAISTADRESVAALITSMKRRPIRHLLLDLDYRTGHCLKVEFEGDAFGSVNEHQFVADHHRG